MQIQAEDGQSQRLDLFLHELAPELSRSRIQALIKEGSALVNGEVRRPSYLVRPGDEVFLDSPDPRPVTLVPEAIALDVLHEDSQLLVLDKPPGMTVHPAPGSWQGTLVHALLHHCTDLSGINGELRPGIVHRLDRDTSGLMVVAKSDAAHRHLAKQLEDRTMGRTYTALVWGVTREQASKIEAPLGRHPKDRKLVAVVHGGRNAVTHYETVERFQFTSLLKLRLETGRTHQIRVHLKHIGHPVFGDPSYGGRSRAKGLEGMRQRSADSLLSLIQRQALHAHQLEFVHPGTEELMRFQRDPPSDMNEVISSVRALGAYQPD